MSQYPSIFRFFSHRIKIDRNSWCCSSSASLTFLWIDDKGFECGFNRESEFFVLIKKREDCKILTCIFKLIQWRKTSWINNFLTVMRLLLTKIGKKLLWVYRTTVLLSLSRKIRSLILRKIIHLKKRSLLFSYLMSKRKKQEEKQGCTYKLPEIYFVKIS